MYNFNDVKSTNVSKLNVGDYRKYLINEYDFQLYMYYTLRRRNYKVYIDRDIRNLVKSEYANELCDSILNFNKYTVKNEFNKTKKVTGRPDFIIDVTEFYTDLKERYFIAVECKYPVKETIMSPIFRIREQIESFRESIFYCDSESFQNPPLFLVTPTMFFENIRLITKWTGVTGKTSEGKEKEASIKVGNEMLLQTLHGFLDVGLFGKGYNLQGNEVYGVYDLSRHITSKEIKYYR